MRVLGLAFAVLFMGTVSIGAQASGPWSNMAPVNAGPAPDIVLAWDGGGSRGHPGAIGGERTVAHPRQWSGQWGPPHWGPNRFYGGWGSDWRAGGPDLLGLGPWQRSL